LASHSLLLTTVTPSPRCWPPASDSA